MAYKTKDSLVKALKEQLATRDNQAIKGLLTIYSYQTLEEKCEMQTKEHNNVGFSAFDSERLSDYAEEYKRDGKLSKEHMYWLKRYIPKYARQLIMISIGSGKIKKENGEYVFVK